VANKSRFYIVESSIKSFFTESEIKVFSESELDSILEEKRTLWNLPISMNVGKFIDKLLISNILSKKEITFDKLLSKKERYIISDATVFQVAISLINKSYLSHYSAAFILGLTNQIPKTIYISFEQSKKNITRSILQQEAIDSAFSKEQRISGATAIYDEYTFLIHNGMYANRVGVYSLNNISITNIERTLIDITVRPNYAGGVASVLDIYRKAIGKISINKLVAILDKLNFIYPYHQSIGFYLEKAGFDTKKLEVLRAREMPNKFYLTYQIEDKEYDETWKLYYPKGM
jgi:hypothetical protein